MSQFDSLGVSNQASKDSTTQVLSPDYRNLQRCKQSSPWFVTQDPNLHRRSECTLAEPYSTRLAPATKDQRLVSSANCLSSALGLAPSGKHRVLHSPLCYTLRPLYVCRTRASNNGHPLRTWLFRLHSHLQVTLPPDFCDLRQGSLHVHQQLRR